MEAGAKWWVGFHRMEHYVNQICLGSTQGCHPCMVVLKQKLDKQESIPNYTPSCHKGLRTEDRCWLRRVDRWVILFDGVLIVGNFESMGWHVHHADTATAFLIGDMNSDLYGRWDNKCYNLHKVCMVWSSYCILGMRSKRMLLKSLNPRRSVRAMVYSSFKMTRIKWSSWSLLKWFWVPNLLGSFGLKNIWRACSSWQAWRRWSTT